MKSAGRREAAEGLLSGLYLQGLLLITGILAARLLGPDERGQLALLWIVVLTIVQVGMAGFPLALTFEIAQGVAARRVLRIAYPVAASQLAVAILVYGLAAVTVLDGSVPWLPIVLTAAILPAWLAQGYALAALQGMKSFRALQVLRMLAPTLYTALLVGGIAAGETSLEYVTGAWVVAYSISGVITLAALQRLLPESREESSGDHGPSVKGMARFGLAGFLGSVSPTETFRVDQLIVGLVLSTTDLGLYVAALAFCNLPRFLAQGLGLVAYPRVAAETEPERQRSLVWRFTAIGTLAAVLVAAPVVALAEPLMSFAFGDAFASAAPTMQILVGGTVFLCARRLLSDGLRGAGAPGAGSWAEGLSLVALVPALLVFVPPYGLEGVALALALTYLLSLVYLLVAVNRRGLGLRRSDTRA